TLANPGNGSLAARVAVYDLAGREAALVWRGAAAPGLPHLTWAGTGAAAPGLYPVPAKGGERGRTARILCPRLRPGRAGPGPRRPMRRGAAAARRGGGRAPGRSAGGGLDRGLAQRQPAAPAAPRLRRVGVRFRVPQIRAPVARLGARPPRRRRLHPGRAPRD